MGEILRNYLIYIFILFGVIIVTAYLIGLMHNLFIRNTGKLGHKLHYITAFIGTPIHELGHLSMNIIFMHKVESYSLLHFQSETGELGYVKYSYNPKSIYQQIGNFFTAIGPIIFGGFVLFVLMFFLANDQYDMVVSESQNIINNQSGLSFSSIFSSLFDYVGEILSIFFSMDFILSPNFFIFTLLSFSVAFHMSLSNADIKNGIKGGLIFLFIILLFGLILGLISPNLLSQVNNVIVTIIYNVMIFFLFTLIINFIITLFGFAYRLIVIGIKSLLS